MNMFTITENLSIRESDRFFSESVIPRIVTSAVRNSIKSQAELASELNLNANLITMFKQGRTKVPISRAAELARVLNINEQEFVRLVLESYHQEVLKAIEATFVVSKTVDENEAFKRARKRLKKKAED
ncbi:helix-turn-helix domain-containing protein [Vibrio sp. Vb339]|uniref:helix-turn-helix domain-containing protein n=1 Tax=Vibrio sp. Vb339 TaxID=1192013 RepID=UPI001555BB41|nr:helix-turn-helix transcriptional regulator [Vibrio sp. Vb339]